MTPQLYIDLDGVLADFDTHCKRCFEIDMNRNGPEPKGIWDLIRGHKDFYLELPEMSDAKELWTGAKELHPNPIILTGVPYSVPEAADNKLAWVRAHIDARADVICCRSAFKKEYCKPGDVLVDDWSRYRSVWEEAGGHFILHTSARQSLLEAAQLLFAAAQEAK